MPEPSKHPGSLFITSAPDDDGIYHLALEWGPDEAVSLSDEEAAAWARGVLMAAAIARHEERLVRELVGIGMEQDAMGLLVQTLRGRRGLPPPGPLGLELIPQVRSRDLSGFLILRRNGEDIGQWTIEDATGHAEGIFMAVVTLGLDTALYQTLMSEFGLPGPSAAGLISAMGMDAHDHSQEADPPNDGEK
jgi:hypothetical protein